MAGSGLDSDDDLIAGINVTPLVDVVLVLLVIFLITAPVLFQSAIKVQLPKASTGDRTQNNTTLQFAVTREGTVSWNAQVLSWDLLEQKLRTEAPQSPEQVAYISADQTTPHGTVIKLMDVLRKYGLTRFALNVDAQ